MIKASVLFPGQGAQYLGMGSYFTKRYAFAKSCYEEASEAVGFDLLHLSEQGPEDHLILTANAQPAILVAGYVAYQAMLQETGLEPAFLVGHSLGEITALTCAGAIPFIDAVKLVHLRGQLMQNAAASNVGAMISVIGPDAEAVQRECTEASSSDGIVVISNYNSNEQTVISGHRQAVEHCADKLAENGAKMVRLQVSAPFHSPLMTAAADGFRKQLDKLVYHPLKYPVVSTVTAEPYENELVIPELLTRQLTAPVQWVQAMRYLIDQGIVVGVDMGPSQVTLNLMRKISPAMKLFAYDQEQDRERLNLMFRKKLADATSTRAFLSRCLAFAVCTPNTNWNAAEYEEGVSKPYKQVHQLQLVLDEEERLPNEEEMLTAIAMLDSVFNTKGTPLDERRQRFDQLMKETGTKELFEKWGGKRDVAGQR